MKFVCFVVYSENEFCFFFLSPLNEKVKLTEHIIVADGMINDKTDSQSIILYERIRLRIFSIEDTRIACVIVYNKSID